MCFGFGALKILDRIQTIPFEIILKASGALSTVGPLFRTSNFYLGSILRGGGP